MEENPEYIQLFRTLLDPEKPSKEGAAAAAMIAAARETRWWRGQSCGAVIASGSVACILEGAVRKFAIRPNGQRQIIDVVVTGDFLGLTPFDPVFMVEAVSDQTRTAWFTREQIDRLKACFPAVSELMQKGAADAIRRLEQHLLMQGRITARAKVGAYLAAMTHRMQRSPCSRIVLPVTRYDIADHLGIAVETVSRTMTELRRGGSIAIRTPRDIEVIDEATLSDLYC